MGFSQRRIWEEIFSSEPYRLEELINGNEWVSVKSSPLLPYVIKNINYKNKILEAGCGRGQWVIYLHHRGYQIIGVDFAISAMRKTKCVYPGINLIGGDVNQLCFQDNSFDAVMCWSVLDHIESGPLNALKEIYRVTKPDGFLFITVPCQNLLYLWLKPILFLKDILRKNRLLRKILRKADIKKDFFQNEFTVQRFRKYLESTGFQIKNIHPLGYEAGFINVTQKILGRYSNLFYKTSQGRWLGLTRLGNLICRTLGKFSRLLTPDEIFYLARK
ncbi:MAG: class I SAM-dependent methyltransferase [candidate division WOR-3 bacterium]